MPFFSRFYQIHRVKLKTNELSSKSKTLEEKNAVIQTKLTGISKDFIGINGDDKDLFKSLTKESYIKALVLEQDKQKERESVLDSVQTSKREN
jgi:hypothetical protein